MESQYEITKAGGLRKIYKALRSEQILQREALKILTIFSKSGMKRIFHSIILFFFNNSFFCNRKGKRMFSDNRRNKTFTACS